MNEVTQCAGPVSTNAGLISCAGVTGSGCITYHAYATLLSGLKMSPETQQPPGSVLLSAHVHVVHFLSFPCPLL